MLTWGVSVGGDVSGELRRRGCRVILGRTILLFFGERIGAVRNVRDGDTQILITRLDDRKEVLVKILPVTENLMSLDSFHGESTPLESAARLIIEGEDSGRQFVISTVVETVARE